MDSQVLRAFLLDRANQCRAETTRSWSPRCERSCLYLSFRGEARRISISPSGDRSLALGVPTAVPLDNKTWTVSSALAMVTLLRAFAIRAHCVARFRGWVCERGCRPASVF